MRYCKSVCSFFDKYSFKFGEKIYQKGVKYCSTCDIFLKIVGYRCPCCKSNLRFKSHTKKWRINCLN